MPIEKPNKFDFAINGTVANEIGLEIPADLLEYVID
jgi:putative ABC transport system substrate-binding protein